MTRRGGPRASAPGRRSLLRRWATPAALALALAGFLAVVSRPGPPPHVWTPRPPGRPETPTAVVRDGPGGAPVVGRWIVVEGFSGAPRVALVRVPDDAAPADAVPAENPVYEPTGRVLSTAGGPWYEWRLRGN